MTCKATQNTLVLREERSPHNNRQGREIEAILCLSTLEPQVSNSLCGGRAVVIGRLHCHCSDLAALCTRTAGGSRNQQQRGLFVARLRVSDDVEAVSDLVEASEAQVEKSCKKINCRCTEAKAGVTLVPWPTETDARTACHVDGETFEFCS